MRTIIACLSAVLMFAATPSLAKNFENNVCFRHSARDKSQGLHGASVGFKYNPYIITTLRGAQSMLEAASRHYSRANPTLNRRILSRKRAIDAYINSFPDYRRKSLLNEKRVAHAPLVTRRNDLCDSGSISFFPGEYVIGYGGDVRVIGDICASPAQIAMEARVTGGQLSLERILSSTLGRGAPLNPSTADTGWRSRANAPFEALILDLVAISQAQCGRPTTDFDLHVRYGRFALQRIVDGENVDKVRLSVFPAADGLRMNVEMTARAAQTLRYAQNRRQRYDRSAGRDERAAVGGMLVIGALSLLGAVSPCWENPNDFSC